MSQPIMGDSRITQVARLEHEDAPSQWVEDAGLGGVVVEEAGLGEVLKQTPHENKREWRASLGIDGGDPVHVAEDTRAGEVAADAEDQQGTSRHVLSAEGHRR